MSASPSAGIAVDPVAGGAQRVRAARSPTPACRGRRRCRAGSLGRVGRQHDGDALVAFRRGHAREAVPYARARARRAVRSGSARVGDDLAAGPSSSSTTSLNAKDGPMMRPSNSGMATPVATSSGDEPGVVGQPLGSRPARRPALDDRDAERRRDPGPPSRRRRSSRRARCERRRDDRVDAVGSAQLERGHVAVGVAAQRVRPDRAAHRRRPRRGRRTMRATYVVFPATRWAR